MEIMSARRMKLLVALLLLSLCVSKGTSVYADAAGLKNAYSECYTFTFADSTIPYYLDGNNMPYMLQNGNYMPMALPLDHLRVTDETVLSDLNMLKDNQRIGGRSFNPSSYFDMTNGGTYTDTFYLTNSYQNTPYIRVNLNHHIIRIRTSNEVKNSIFTGKKISYIVYYYFEPFDCWYSYEVNDINVSNDIGSPLNLSGLYPYVYYGVKKSSDLSQADIHIWQTDV